METTHQILQSHYYPPPPSPPHLRRRQDAQQHRPQSAMPLRREPTFRRLTTTTIAYQFGLKSNHHLHQRLLPSAPINIISIYHKTMADRSTDKDTQLGTLNSPSTTAVCERSEAKDKESEKKSTHAVVPPPPEKPLPGDCCGSGCVRCVWDVYYEELEEYNRLYKSDSSKPS